MNEYNGITLNNGTYKVQLSRKGRTFYLGNYPTAVQAAMGYDRAVHLSAAWSTKRHNLNFPDNPKPSDESTFTEFEKQMLTHLRTYFPEAEKDAKNKKLVDLETPDVLLRDFQNVRDRKDAFVNTMVETLASAESTILRMASALADLKQSKQFYVDKLAEAEATIVRLRGVKHEDGKPKWKMTPVAPKGIVAEKFEERRNEVVLPDAPASPVHPIFVETAPLAPVLRHIEKEEFLPANSLGVDSTPLRVQGQAVMRSGVEGGVYPVGIAETAKPAITPLATESEKEDDPEPIYPVVPGAKNPVENEGEESAENPGFSKE